MNVKYPVVVIKSGNVFHGIVPDVVVSCVKGTVEDVLNYLEQLVKGAIQRAQALGNEIPTASSHENVIKQWEGHDVYILTVSL